jgi:Circularly permutated YpsA SLOG family
MVGSSLLARLERSKLQADLPIKGSARRVVAAAWSSLPFRKRSMIQKIISAGQTGSDRMALDWAVWHDIPHGGWCPQGRRAEDGPIETRYVLIETPSSNYPADGVERPGVGRHRYSVREKLQSEGQQ